MCSRVESGLRSGPRFLSESFSETRTLKAHRSESARATAQQRRKPTPKERGGGLSKNFFPLPPLISSRRGHAPVIISPGLSGAAAEQRHGGRAAQKGMTPRRGRSEGPARENESIRRKRSSAGGYRGAAQGRGEPREPDAARRGEVRMTMMDDARKPPGPCPALAFLRRAAMPAAFRLARLLLPPPPGLF